MQYLLEPVYDNIENIYDNYFFIYKNNKVGFIFIQNHKVEWLLPIDFDIIKLIYYNYLLVNNKDIYYFENNIIQKFHEINDKIILNNAIFFRKYFLDDNHLIYCLSDENKLYEDFIYKNIEFNSEYNYYICEKLDRSKWIFYIINNKPYQKRSLS